MSVLKHTTDRNPEGPGTIEFGKQDHAVLPFKVDSNGKISMGDGTNPHDVSIERTGLTDIMISADVSISGSLTAAGVGQKQIVVKPSDTTIQSDQTVNADPHLLLPVVASGIYRMHCLLLFTSGTTPDFKNSFTGPASAAMTWTDTTNATFTINGEDTWSGTGAKLGIALWGVLRVAATPGDLTVTWAQALSTASNTTVHTDSYLELLRVA